MKRLSLATLALSIALAGCGVQTTSGEQYLARWRADVEAARAGDDALPAGAIAEIAAVEPLLRFPARIGIARIRNGSLTAIPEAEAQVWRERLGEKARYGSFHPVSRFVAALASAAARVRPEPDDRGRRVDMGYDRDRRLRHLVAEIRAGAARQHLDAVLVYEVSASTEDGFSAIGLMELTIIGGALLPTRVLDARGRGSAVLIDVRNAYTYGMVDAETDLSELSPAWGSDRRERALGDEAELATVRALAGKVEGMFETLFNELAARR